MASLTIRNLDDALKQRLRVRAANHGRSMEEEVRDIIRTAVEGPISAETNLAKRIRARMAPTGGVELSVPPREPMRAPPDFE